MEELRVAVDIDGTITKFPEVFRRLLGRFPDAIILTGGIDPNPERVDQDVLIAGRIAQLTPIIGPPSNEIVVCVGKTVPQVANMKAAVCLQRTIDIFIDDSTVYCKAVARMSPTTAVLQVFSGLLGG